MSIGSIFGGGGNKIDISSYGAQIAEANARAEEARKAAEEATKRAQDEEEERKRQQADAQNQIADSNKAKRAAASNRFSLLLFEDDLLG